MDTTYNPAVEELVSGSGINKLCPDFQDVNTLAEVQALDIYSHLSGSPKLAAENALLLTVMTFNGEDELTTMAVNHVNGVADNYAGTSGANVQSTSTGAAVESGALVLTPVVANWKTHDITARATKLLVATNIVASDLAATTTAVNLIQGRRTGPSSATSGTRISLTFGATSGSGTGTHAAVASGPSYAGNVGDIGTFYAEIPLAAPTGTENEIGSGNAFDDDDKYYYIIGLSVAASAITKNFKFTVKVQYD